MPNINHRSFNQKRSNHYYQSNSHSVPKRRYESTVDHSTQQNQIQTKDSMVANKCTMTKKWEPEKKKTNVKKCQTENENFEIYCINHAEKIEFCASKLEKHLVSLAYAATELIDEAPQIIIQKIYECIFEINCLTGKSPKLIEKWNCENNLGKNSRRTYNSVIYEFVKDISAQSQITWANKAFDNMKALLEREKVPITTDDLLSFYKSAVGFDKIKSAIENTIPTKPFKPVEHTIPAKPAANIDKHAKKEERKVETKATEEKTLDESILDSE